MAVMISSGFLIAWTPYVVVSFWSMFHTREQGRMAPFVSLLPCLFAKSSTVYNPFIYFIFQHTSGHKLFRLKKQTLCSSLPAEESKLDGNMVKNPDGHICEDGTDETCVGLMREPGKSESEWDDDF